MTVGAEARTTQWVALPLIVLFPYPAAQAHRSRSSAHVPLLLGASVGKGNTAAQAPSAMSQNLNGPLRPVKQPPLLKERALYRQHNGCGTPSWLAAYRAEAGPQFRRIPCLRKATISGII